MRLKRSVVYILAIILLVPSFGFAETAPLSAGIKGYEKIAENSGYVFYADMETGEIALKEKNKGLVWWSNPPGREQDPLAKGIFKMDLNAQLLIRYYNEAKNQEYSVNSFTGSVNKKKGKVEKAEKGITVTYEFPDEKIIIPVEYRLENEYLCVRIPVNRIVEAASCKVLNIGLLPYFGAGGPAENGYMLVPDGSGALIKFNNGKGASDEFSRKIYGRNPSLSLLKMAEKAEDIKLPVFGIKKEDGGLLAVVTQGDAAGSINASVAGKKTSYNNIYCEFELRSTDSYILGKSSGSGYRDIKIYEKGKSALEQCEVRYYPLKAEASDYIAMAKRYRKYLLDEGELKPKVESSLPLYLDIIGAIRKKKPVLGIPVNVTEPLTDFNKCVEIVKRLKKSGIDNIVFSLQGWSQDQVRGVMPDSVDPVSKLGGRKDFRKLTDYLHSSGIRFYPGIDFAAYARGGNGVISFFDAAKTISRSPVMEFTYRLSTFFSDPSQGVKYLLSPEKAEGMLEKFLHAAKKQNIRGIHMERIGSTLYSDFSGAATGRQGSKKSWEKDMTTVKNMLGSVITSGGNAYTLEASSHILNIPVDSSHFDIEDESVPFYQVVIRGIIPCATAPVNLASSPEKLFLKAIENGGALHFVWMAGDPEVLQGTNYNGLYSASYPEWLETAVKYYSEASDVFRLTAGADIKSREKLADEVYVTEYENGVRIAVNYSDKNYHSKTLMVPAQNYVVEGGG